MTGNDPTDQALAVIASIFERPEAKPDDDAEASSPEAAPEAERADPPEQADHAPATQRDDDDAATDQQSPAPEPATPAVHAEPAGDLDRYTRYGPGPLDALRFKWSVRHGEFGYYVDETIGSSSQTISIGPMSREDAIALIDTRARAADKRFTELRNEIELGPSERGYEDDGDEVDPAP